MTRIGGIHHVTAIAGDPQENVDFYAGLLGMRLVKRSVNQDDPGTYHLFYADAEGHPGTDLTFFPHRGGAPGRDGTGLVGEVAFAVPADSLSYWQDRLQDAGVDVTEAPDRFGDPVLTFEDPHGLDLAIVATGQADERTFTPWEDSPVPVDHQVRGLHSVRALVHDADPTARLATDVLGMEPVASEDGWDRYAGSDPTSGFLEVRAAPEAAPGRWGVGAVHHVAWRATDDEAQVDLRDAVARSGLRPTEVIDRFWFKSVYFREPGGVLFELATEEPGFTVDEPLEELGERLILPPWLEDRRDAIEARLPPIELPYPTTKASAEPTAE